MPNCKEMISKADDARACNRGALCRSWSNDLNKFFAAIKTCRACLVLLGLLAYPSLSCAQESSFENFLTNFDYEMRSEMKIDSKELVSMLVSGKAVLVDIRFKEEVTAWRMGFALAIPLNELPKRIKELPKNKIIVTACPHKDRSAIAMAYLRTQGYNAKYLTDGLVGLAELLRGDRARDFVEDMGLDAAKP